MKSGITVEQATAELSTIAARLQKQYPDTNTGRGAVVAPLREFMVQRARTPLVMLFGAVSLLLLLHA